MTHQPGHTTRPGGHKPMPAVLHRTAPPAPAQVQPIAPPVAATLPAARPAVAVQARTPAALPPAAPAVKTASVATPPVRQAVAPSTVTHVHRPPVQQHVTNNYYTQPRTQHHYHQPPAQQKSSGGFALPFLAGFIGGGLLAKATGSVLSGTSRQFSGQPHYGSQYSGQPSASGAPHDYMHPAKFNRLMNAAIEGRDSYINREGREVRFDTGDKQRFKQIVQKVFEHHRIPHNPDGFFVRNILDFKAQGMSDRAIARQIGHPVGSQIHDYSEHFSRNTVTAGGQIGTNPLQGDLSRNNGFLREEYAKLYQEAKQYSGNSGYGNASGQTRSYEQAPVYGQRHTTTIPIMSWHRPTGIL